MSSIIKFYKYIYIRMSINNQQSTPLLLESKTIKESNWCETRIKMEEKRKRSASLLRGPNHQKKPPPPPQKPTLFLFLFYHSILFARWQLLLCVKLLSRRDYIFWKLHRCFLNYLIYSSLFNSPQQEIRYNRYNRWPQETSRFEFESKATSHTHRQASLLPSLLPSLPHTSQKKFPTHRPTRKLVPSDQSSIQNRVPTKQKPHSQRTRHHTHIKIEKETNRWKKQKHEIQNNFPTFQPDTELHKRSLLMKIKDRKIWL